MVNTKVELNPASSKSKTLQGSIVEENLVDHSTTLPSTFNNFRHNGGAIGEQYQNNLRVPSGFQMPVGTQLYGNDVRGFNQQFNRAPIPPPRIRATDYSNPYGSSQGYNNNTFGQNSYLSSYNRPFNSYGLSSYGNGGSYMTPYNNLQAPEQSSFLRDAQESSRDTFAVIENVVSTFGSINMMIESTYYALQSSFNAVLSVIDNVTRLKIHFGQILSAFTLIRTCQWLLKKLLYLIGLRDRDPTTESAWKNASLPKNNFTSKVRSSWPSFTFMIAIYALPYLLWKSLSSILSSNKTSPDWTGSDENEYYAVALYNYQAQHPDELSMVAGDKLKLAPMNLQTDKSWPIAFNGTSKGTIPVNYIKIKPNENFHSNGVDLSSDSDSKEMPASTSSKSFDLVENEAIASVHQKDPKDERVE